LRGEYKRNRLRGARRQIPEPPASVAVEGGAYTTNIERRPLFLLFYFPENTYF